jgi:CDP-paratose 2-epimerase
MNLFITGGAGFIGCNSADYFLNQGHTVTIFDNLSRPGATNNLNWLQLRHNDPDQLQFVEGDVRNYDSLSRAIDGSDAVLHLAGQVAVTTSVNKPRDDFEINALGTFNVLESVRNYCPDARLINASTNKVYGGMTQIEIVDRGDRYAYADYPYGVSETAPLDFHSPYGCSKGSADQYTIDYARIYGLKTLTFRQSCIYGQRQFGVEDQGWVAHFVIAAVKNRPITIFGDGKQVRDVLHIDDLVQAYDLGFQQADQLSGAAFNIGGGIDNTLAVWTEFGTMLEELSGHDIAVHKGDWRPGDQRVFISDIRKARELLAWQPTIAPKEGIAKLFNWVSKNPDLFD